MAKASKKSPEEKLRVVLSVLRGELSVAAAGRRAGVSEQMVHNWKKAFLEGGRDRLALGARRRSAHEAELEAECEELKAALGEAHVQLRVWKKGAEYLPRRGPQMIRTDAGCSVSRFAELVGVPRRTYHARLARHRAGDVTKGPWPAPVVDRIEPTVEKLAAGWPVWGHRKIWAMGHWDGWDLGSPSSVHRAMARRGLLQPVRYRAERRQLAAARREAFLEPPARRNRVRQVDFSAFETTTEGIWQLCGVVDYAAKPALACPVTVTQTAGDLIFALETAVEVAEALLGRPLVEDCTDPATGEVVPLVIVSDNGPAMKSAAVARWFAARPHLAAPLDTYLTDPTLKPKPRKREQKC